MNYKLRNSGFSLSEVLIAIGILAVGMVFVAGVFPAAIYLTTVATERTVAAVAADEAFAKVKIYGIDLSKLSDSSLNDFNSLPAAINIDSDEFEYPSVDTNEPNQYRWSALCRRVESEPGVVDPNLVQVTVFVSRKANPNLKYPAPPDGSSGTVDWPRPVKVSISTGSNLNELQIGGGKETYINDGYTIVDDATGRIYRVLERYKGSNDSTVLLDRNWDNSPPGGTPQNVWVVPPPVTHGRYPCITVYQRIIEF